MKYVPYLTLIVSFALGFFGYPFPFVLAVAIVSTFLLFSPRRKALRNQAQAPDQNMFLDGAFLLASQTLIHFVLFAFGIFIARMVVG
ncbi:hypothetical protein GCM10007853_14120 [Algimonas ampicilliniresistens]|jgi:hypothetical protein|uniref:Uncharacterized protein n=1 Tax=Algimonas ampicilliniresistens TaxID=1298735 RepID=A0ABQ5V7L4_9PROT|nr:hypothetical protein [Algimonas ampicilliniresistens]GLQ23538.1 hypothetical protein GCM10007853_14120 [Algimonas ampicilliniresistens]